jgi:SEC-C motif-containing protein
MEMQMNCPCGSAAEYAACCEPIIKGTSPAATAEQLMRARYSAYTQVEMEFLQESLHPDSRGDSDPEGARDWAQNSEWHGLVVLNTEAGGPDDDKGTVEFIASYTYEGEDKQYREVAEFERVDGQWHFRAGRPALRKPIVREEPKVGRNDACPCGSGRKYKRCCGA